MFAFFLIAAPGFIEVDGGVAQEAFASESEGWRCDADNPLKVTIEGKALIYVELFTTAAAKGKVLPLALSNEGREVVLDALPAFVKLKKPVKGFRAHNELLLEVPEGPQSYVLRCAKRFPMLVKLLSIERSKKKLPTVR